MNIQRITECQRQAILALVNVEASRVSANLKTRKAAQHVLFSAIRQKYGAKYSALPRECFKDAASWLLMEPLG